MTQQTKATKAKPRFSLTERRKRAVKSLSAEVERICSIPPWTPLTKEDIDDISWHYVKPEYYEKGFRLNYEQATAMCMWNDYHGLFGPIKVGKGKTLIALLIANDCYREILLDNIENKAKRIPRMLLLVPAGTVTQIKNTQIEWTRKRTIFQTPVHVVSGIPKAQRMRLAKSRMRGMYVMSYNVLSLDGAEEMLEWIDPEVVIADEAHMLTGKGASGRSRKYKAFQDKHKARLVAMSGTLTDKSPMDYYTLARESLGLRNFLPNSVSMASTWSALIGSDAGGMCSFEPDGMPGAGPLKPILNWAREWFPDEEIDDTLVGYRKAFKLRQQSMPGVDASGDDEIGNSLLIKNLPVANEGKDRPGYELMQELVRRAVEDGETPSGDPIDHAMHVWKWRNELEGCGFYNELYWPEEDKYAKTHRITVAEAHDILERSKEYLRLRQAYHRVLRKWVDANACTGLYTTEQIGSNMTHHQDRDVGEGLYRVWKESKDADFDGRIDRYKRVIRVCDYKINACLEWVKDQRKKSKKKPLFIWYYNADGVGQWMYEVLKEAGIPATFCPAGSKYTKLFDKWNREDEESGKSSMEEQVCIASMGSHGTGKNMQFTFGCAYFLQWPRSAKLAEQCVGRKHRLGQRSDTVEIFTNITCEFDQVNLAATMNDSAYMSQSQSRQKLMFATYDPLPQRVSYPVLVEFGTKAKSLTEEAQAILDSVLGG